MYVTFFKKNSDTRKQLNAFEIEKKNKKRNNKKRNKISIVYFFNFEFIFLVCNI